MAKKKNENVVEMEQPVEKNEQVEEDNEQPTYEEMGFIYYPDLDMRVKAYPTTDEYDLIARNVCDIINWAERRCSIELFILNMFTDLGEEKIQEIAESIELFGSQFMESVKSRIANLFMLDDAIMFYDNPSTVIKTFLNGINDVLGGDVAQKILGGIEEEQPEE